MDDGHASQRRFLYLVLPIAGLIGMATGATALIGLAAAGFALLALAYGDSRRALLGLRVSRELYPSAFEDDAVRVSCLLENRSSRTACLVEIQDAFGPGVADHQRLLEPGPVSPQRRHRLAYRTFCSRPWGEYRVGPLSLEAGDPLGLFRARRGFPEIAAFTVFPRVHRVAALERLGARHSLTPQDVTAGRSDQSLTYLGVRDHRPGDEARRIHWPATARRGSLAVKEQEIDLVPYFTLFLDLHRSGRAGTGRRSTLEYVVRSAASLVWSAAARGEVVQAIGEGAAPLLVPPGRGELHAIRCLYELVRVRQEGRTDVFDLVDRHHAQIPEGSTAVLLLAGLLFDDLRLREALASWRARAVRGIVVVVNDASFAPVDRWPLPPERQRERAQAILGLLGDAGAAGALLHAEQDLASELARPDLFGDAP